MINGSISYSSKRSRATLLLSSDGDPKASYKCRLDGRKFKNCELTNYNLNYCIVGVFSKGMLSKFAASSVSKTTYCPYG